jgi:hypothetical protein
MCQRGGHLTSSSQLLSLSFLSQSSGLVMRGIGGSQSKNITLECMLKNFKKEFNKDYGIKLSPDRLRTFCAINWPTLV